ncbi:MAG: NAD(+) kinase [Gammaproteobacteria bacterium]|nr:NAD(+) kinase [Gammaproteobacteria bacterium]
MTNKFKSVGIIAKHNDMLVFETVRSLHDFLQSNDIQICVDEDAKHCLENTTASCVDIKDMHKHIDLAIVVGGDGTLLAAAQSMVEHDTPIIGINRGRLGFLTNILPENMHYDLKQIFNGEFTLETRTVMTAKHMRGDEQLAACLAINDVVLHARYVVRMIELETRIDDEYLNTVRADGLIVATPTGSTAYSLSGGGPIVHPSVATTLLVPICPHTLSNRPIAVDENSRIEIVYSTHNELNGIASIDGQMESEVIPGDRIIMQRSTKPLTLVQPNSYSFFKVLREKLNWSQQP